MRRIRLTYEGAFHHGMNRSINGENIFEGDQNKALILGFLEEATLKYRIRILVYCVMDNHYHLILQTREGIVQNYAQYIWNSGSLYYSGDSSSIVDTGLVEELFCSRSIFLQTVKI